MRSYAANNGSLGATVASSPGNDAGWAMVDVDAVITDSKRVQTVALGGEILSLC